MVHASLPTRLRGFYKGPGGVFNVIQIGGAPSNADVEDMYAISFGEMFPPCLLYSFSKTTYISYISLVYF